MRLARKTANTATAFVLLGTPAMAAGINSPLTAVSWAPGQRVIARGHFWTIAGVELGEACSALQLTGDSDPARPRTLLSPFDRISRATESSTPAVVRIPRWTREVRDLCATQHPAGTLRAAAPAAIRLLPYQLEPALAVVRHGCARLLIADEVGLGKTVQAGLIAAELSARHPSLRALIVTPAGLRDQWQRELARLFNLSCTAADASWLKAATHDRPAHVNPWGLPGIYLASHDFVKRPEVLRPLEEVWWDLFVMDEAHAASVRSDRRTAAHALACRAAHVVLLTATPPLDVAHEYEALCAIGRIDRGDDSMLVFRRTRQDLRIGQPRKSALLAVRPTEAETRMHRLLEDYTRRIWREASRRNDDLARLVALILRKRALSSAASLASSVRRRLELLVSDPAPQPRQLFLPLEEEEPLPDEEPLAALAAPGLADAARERRWLAAIAAAAARAAAGESKVRFVHRFLSRVREPVIIFTEYRDTLERLRASLARSGLDVLVLHGGMSPAERSRVQQDFNAISGPSTGGVVLLATDAASEGLNLHIGCRTIVHYELPWSTARLEQRAGRVDRFGQNRRVHEAALVLASTAERLVLGPLLRRAANARQRAPAAGGMPAALTESRVAQIVLGESPPAPPPLPARNADRPLAATFSEDAERESERLAGARAMALHTRSSTPDRTAIERPIAAVLRRRRSRLVRGVVLVFRLSLSDSAARQFHADSIVIACPWPVPHRGPRRARDIRRAAAAFTSLPSVRAALTGEICRALDSAAPIHASIERSRERRAAAMRRRATLTAQRLVQIGLFERRGGSAPASTARDSLPVSTTRAKSASLAAVDVSLAAALLVV